MSDLEFRVKLTSSLYVFFEYKSDCGNICSNKCCVEGWEFNETDKRCHYRSSFPNNFSNNDYDLTMEELTDMLNKLSSYVVNKAVDKTELKSLIVVFKFLPIILGEIKCEESICSQKDRLSKICNLYQLDESLLK